MPHRICLGKAPTWSAHYVPKTNSTTPSFEQKTGMQEEQGEGSYQGQGNI